MYSSMLKLAKVINILIPYPFVTQGANPVQIYNSAPSGYNPTGSVINSQFSMSGGPWLIANWSTDTFGATHQITITNEGYTGPVYITVHLDYGLKKVAGDYSKNLALDAVKGSYSVYGSIINNNAYAFSVSGPFSDSDSISNINVFKNDPGIGGLVLGSDGSPIVGAKVQIYQGKTILGTVYTDTDGWYMFNYKYTGKSTSFTVKTTGFADQTVTLKANGFLVVNFGVA